MRSDLDVSLLTPRASIVRALWISCAVFYVLLSCLDLFFTHLLVNDVGGVYEANPLAAEILERYGWAGVAAFEASCVVVVLGAAVWLWRRRPRAARLLLACACLTTLVVVAYSVLLSDFGGEAAHWGRQLAQARTRAGRLALLHEAQHAYSRRVNELTEEITHGRRGLREAAADLAGYLEQVRHNPLPYLERHYQGLGKEATLAAHLIRQVGFQVSSNPEQARRQLRELTGQFAAYQAPLPRASSESFTATLPRIPGRRGAVN